MDEKQKQHETAGTFAIVGCEDNPNYQVWGARSDLKCRRRKKDRILKMSFKDWVEKDEGGESDGGQKQ